MTRASLTDPLTPRNVQPVGHTGFGDPVFSDEFDVGTLNTDKWLPWYPDTSFWNTTTPGGHKTNTNEPQGYDETGITFVDDSLGDKVMRFTLHESNHAVPELTYTSGMVCSYPSFNPVHGYFEARMKLTEASGSWPAFWMVRTDQTWPPEIDWMEHWGSQWQTNTKHGYYYGPPQGGGSHDDYNHFTNVANDWHVFGGLWEPGRLRWFVDGVLVKEINSPAITNSQMYLICNLAGDKDNKAGVAASAPFHVDVDYIRAWSLDGVDVSDDSGVYDHNGSPLTPYILVDGNLVSVSPRTFL